MTKKLLLVAIMAMAMAGLAFAQGKKAFSGYSVGTDGQLAEGAWCWFADPRALHYESKDGKIDATYIGYIDYHGSIKAMQIDHKRNKRAEVLVRSWFQPDDHDNPSFLVLPDGRVMIIYSRHTDEPCFYYRISRRPGDITCLGEEKRLATANNTTYPNPFILSDDPNHIYMCWRGIGWHPTVAQMSMPDNDDNIKFTWGPYQMVQSSGARPYAKYVSNGKDKIGLAYTTGHPDNEYPNWLYYNIFDINDRCLYDINGNKLSNVKDGPFKVRRNDEYAKAYPATVVDRTDDRRDWLWNIAIDKKSASPIISMTKINKEKDSHDYYYATWDGKGWHAAFIANGGGHFHQTPTTERCYSGGMAIDRDNVNDVYCSVPVDGVYEIVKYTMSDDGSKVVASEQVTRNSKENNSRPLVIEGTRKGKHRLAWMNGKYYYWIVNTRYKNAYPTTIMIDSRLPKMDWNRKNVVMDMNVLVDKDNYEGELVRLSNGIVYGVDADQYPYVKIDEVTFKGQNVLGTADSWATDNNATTDGRWYSKTKLPAFRLSMSLDGEYLTVWRNGMVDIKVPCVKKAKEKPDVKLAGNVKVITQKSAK